MILRYDNLRTGILVVAQTAQDFTMQNMLTFKVFDDAQFLLANIVNFVQIHRSRICIAEERTVENFA